MKREERKVKSVGRAAFAARFLNCAGKMREARGKMHLAGKGGRRQTADMKTDGKRNGFFRHAALLALAGGAAECGIDEKNPRGILVRLEKWEKKHGKP